MKENEEKLIKKNGIFSFHLESLEICEQSFFFRAIKSDIENSPHLLHLMNVESFRAFLINLMLGMRRSTGCRSMREYLKVIDAHLHSHLH